MNVFSLLDQAAGRFAQRGAVYVGAQPAQSYAELRQRSLRFASALRKQQPAASRIVIATENCAQYLELMFGTWAAECTVVPLNFKLHAKEMAQIVADSGAAIAFASPKLVASLAAALGVVCACTVVEIGSPAYDEFFEGDEAAPPLTDPQSLAWLFYTSGTTGRSKGAMLTHRNLLAATVAHLADVEIVDEGASLIHAAPMSHGSGMYVLPYVARGARQVIPASGGFEPEEFIELCNQHPACGAFLALRMGRRHQQAGRQEPIQ